MEMKEYKTGDRVEVLMNNPRNDNKDEWRTGVVTDIQMISPSRGEKHKPYPMVMVKTVRTYFKSVPRYENKFNTKVYVGDDGTFYDKENTEGFIYENQIKLRTT